MKNKVSIPSCHRCRIPDGVLLKYQITADGKYQYFWYCSRCECITPRGCFVSHEVINQFNLPAEFYIKGLLRNYQVNIYCDICGALGAQLHHFAPQSMSEMFGENYHKWPTINLCVDCHRLWHVIVTPYLPGYSCDPRAKQVLEKYKAR